MTSTTVDTAAHGTVEPVVADATAPATRLLRWWPEASVVAVSLVLNLWGLSRNGYGNTYYAAAVRSMTQSWSNFFYGALDPGGWITVDKPPASLWLQAASVKAFGYSSWSMLAPQAVCGALAVALLLVTVRRVWGRWPGLVAGATLTLMPVSVAVARSNTPDMGLVLCAVAAAFALERAIATDKLRWLAAVGLFVALGFLAKLLVIGVVVPAFGLAYLVASRRSFGRRLLGLLVTSAVALAVCGVWIAAVDLRPLTSRPYIGGSTDGSALDLVFGYNGLARVTGSSGGPGGGGRPGGGIGTGGIDQFGGTPGLGRLFNAGMGDQVMWLAPVVAVALVAGAYVLARRRRLDDRVGSLVAFGGWAVTAYLVFAFADGIFHNYYVSLLAPAVAVLVGIGAALVLEGGRLARFVAGGTLAVTAWLQLRLMQRVDALTWLRPLVVAGTLAVAAAFVVAGVRYRRPHEAAGEGVGVELGEPVGEGTLGEGAPGEPQEPRRASRLVPVLVAAGAAVVLVAPAAWSASALGKAASGTFPDARPGSSAGGFGGPGGALGGGGQAGGEPAGGGAVGGGLSDDLLAWLRSQRTTERWLVAVGSSMQGAEAIIGGDSVLPIGGFSGSDPSLPKERFAELVADGDLRFVLAGTSVSAIAAEACTAVPVSTWGGTSSATGVALYDCAGKADAILASSATVSREGGPGGGIPGGGFPGGQDGVPGAGQGGIDALRTCLAGQGVTLPEQGSGQPPNLSDPAVQAAFQACGLAGPGAGQPGTIDGAPATP